MVGWSGLDWIEYAYFSFFIFEVLGLFKERGGGGGRGERGGVV